jgi:hypothetical protein
MAFNIWCSSAHLRRVCPDAPALTSGVTSGILDPRLSAWVETRASEFGGQSAKLPPAGYFLHRVELNPAAHATVRQPFDYYSNFIVEFFNLTW